MDTGDPEASGFRPLSKYKVVLLGEHGVGKTSLSACFMRQPFEGSYAPTIGIDFSARNVYLDNASIRLQIWDTAGQERFRSLVPSYIRDCSAALIVYDVTKVDSFDAVDSWVKQIQKYSDAESVMISIAGNKTDIVEDEPMKRQVQFNQGQEKANQWKAALFCETSAKTAYNVQYLFHKIAELSHSRRLRHDVPDLKAKSTSVTIDGGATANQNGKMLAQEESKSKCCSLY